MHESQKESEYENPRPSCVGKIISSLATVAYAGFILCCRVWVADELLPLVFDDRVYFSSTRHIFAMLLDRHIPNEQRLRGALSAPSVEKGSIA